MEKINLNGLYKDAVNARIAALREKAEIFVEKEAIPALVDAAKNGDFSHTIQVPSGLVVENVIEIIAEQVEYKNLTRDCRRLNYFWG
jgi:hypothetical protein